MAMTSADVNNQSFSIDRKGYNVDEVDAFLERIADDLDELNGRIAQLQDELRSASAKNDGPVAITSGSDKDSYTQRDINERDARIDELEHQVSEQRADDSAIAQALIIAQRSADEIVANANSNADKTREDAEDEAQRILDKANNEKQRVLDEIKKLEDDREETRVRYQDMLNDFIGSAKDVLDDIAPGKSGKSRGSHGVSTYVPAGTSVSEAVSATTAAYTTPSKSAAPVAKPQASKVEKDFSGFGDTDDGFEFDDID